jgi:hypothetical protein
MSGVLNLASLPLFFYYIVDSITLCGGGESGFEGRSVYLSFSQFSQPQRSVQATPAWKHSQ